MSYENARAQSPQRTRRALRSSPRRQNRPRAPAAGRSGGLRAAAARPTRSASSRSSRARRWRRCRASSPTTLLRPRRQVAIIRPGPIVGQMVHPYLNRRAGREPVALSASLARADPRADARRAAVPGAAAAHRDGGGRVHRRAGRGAAAGLRVQAVRAADEGRSKSSCATGMARSGITGDGRRTDHHRRSRRSRCTGFPESHAASFALLAYASAYLKVHYPAAFYTALLNNQPMGFYHPSTLVKDAQRRGVRFPPIDVQVSTGTARSKRTGPFDSACATSPACGRRWG